MLASLPDGVPTDEIRATVSDLEGGLALLSRAKAVGRIDDWHRLLSASDRDDLQQIAESLAELKNHLLGPDLDGDAIGAVLARLGRQTAASARHAEPEEVARAAERLGHLLLHAGHALRGPISPS